jgi:hypothetical protein
MPQSLLTLVLAGLVLQGCGSTRPPPGPQNLTCNLKNYYVTDVFEDRHVYITKRFQAIRGERASAVVEETNILELSAGGEYGAYGAGFLVGWGEAGEQGLPAPRSKIHIVTGVSTGSIIATSAFLGDRDARMKELYENLKDETIYTRRSALSLLWANSLYDAAGKRALLKKYIDTDVIDLVAGAEEGRYLYIGIVDLDKGEFKRINMVKLARELKGNNRDECFRAVIDASSATEVAFEPVFIDSVMYGDGGVRRHLFLVSPETIKTGTQPRDLSGTAYRSFALIHGDLEVEPQTTGNGLLSISERTASIFTDQTLKDSVRLNNALATHPDAVVGEEAAKRMPRFYAYYAAASAQACRCKKETEDQCKSSSTSGGADIFCQPYMKCLSDAGERDGKTYASTGHWLPFEDMNLGSGPSCTVATGEVYRARPVFP